MKTTGLTLTLLILPLAMGMAQTQKGSWQVCMQVGDFTYQKNDYSRLFSGSLTPSVGYFVATNLLLGAGIPLSLTSNRYDYTNSSNETIKGIGLSPFVRYYLGPAKLKPYIGLAYSYNYIRRNNMLSGSPGSSTQRTSILSPTIGIAYFVAKNVALNAGLSYNIQHLANEGTSPLPNSDPFSYSTDSKSLTLSIGFQLFF